MTLTRRQTGHSEITKSSTTRKKRKPVIGGSKIEIVDGTQEIPGRGMETATALGGSPIVELKRRHAPIRPTNTCSFSFSDGTMPGKPLASSDTRGKINRITKAIIGVSPATSSSATTGRG